MDSNNTNINNYSSRIDTIISSNHSNYSITVNINSINIDNNNRPTIIDNIIDSNNHNIDNNDIDSINDDNIIDSNNHNIDNDNHIIVNINANVSITATQ